MKKPHKHAELIKAWADGAEIEYLNVDGEWQDAGSGVLFSPAWKPSTEYRIKPEPKKDKTYYLVQFQDDEFNNAVFKGGNIEWINQRGKRITQIKVVLDGDTLKPKSAEVIL